MDKIKNLGQVFTSNEIVCKMLELAQQLHGRVLEPSCGEGVFAKKIKKCVSIELDAKLGLSDTLKMDFFDYPLTEKFDTIIGNPPYVRYQNILESTKGKLNSTLFDKRSNLYLFFIEKCINHLKKGGELIFIVPREFLKATSSIKLNEFIFKSGTITDCIDLGDKRIFSGFTPNCIIFRFQKGLFQRKTNNNKIFSCVNGQLLFLENEYPVKFNDVFSVKVGAISGNNKIFEHKLFGNLDFVCSDTHKTGKTKKMIFNAPHECLNSHKGVLLQRKIKRFNENNWWQWGRVHYISNKNRIYVNVKTRNSMPFFTHSCRNYDGTILALFPKNQSISVLKLVEKLNMVDWEELGFICQGRYIFSQKSLENTILPTIFKEDTFRK